MFVLILIIEALQLSLMITSDYH